MRAVFALFVLLTPIVLTGCSAVDDREWMKINQRYTKQEFQRDYKECTRKGDVDEPCMRERGWLPVSPSKSEAPPPAPPTPSRGRY